MLLRQLWWVVSMDPRRRRKRAGLGDSEHNWPLPRRRLALVLVAAVVTTALAIFGLQHAPNCNTRLFGSAGPEAISLKSKIATGILGLALLQLLLVLWIYGQIPGRATAPHQVRTIHRTCGIILFLATLPVAVHCMFAYGVQTTSARVTIHS